MEINHSDWLTVIAKAYRTGVEDYSTEGVSIRRVRGGANNAMYRVRVHADEFACKLCVADERYRAQREFAALRLIGRTGLHIAPRPILIDESCTVLPFPVVAYRWIGGKALTSPLSDIQVSAILESIQSFHALEPANCKDADLIDAWFHWFSFDTYLIELKAFLHEYGEWIATTDVDGKHLYTRLEYLIESCIATVSKSRVDPSRAKIALRLAHVDPNLSNAIWDEQQRLRWVDWEYSGWGDPALELADLRWHISLEDVLEAQHAWFRQHYRPPEGDVEFEDRLEIWDRILVIRWTFLVARALWIAMNGPDRVRLTVPQENPGDIRARLVRTIERAERFVSR